MQTPRFLNVRINSNVDPFTTAKDYYGENNLKKYGDEHRTHTSVRPASPYSGPKMNHSPVNVAPTSQQLSVLSASESW